MAAIDPITVSVIQHRLRAIVEEMGEAMLRTAYSQILNSSRDFSTALCDPQGRLIASPKDTPLCRLWLAMLQRFGVGVDRFADADVPLV